MGVNTYFGPRRTSRTHATPNYRPVTSESEVDYYRQTYFSSETIFHIRKIRGKSVQEVMYSYKGFSSDYMEFVGYETCE